MGREVHKPETSAPRNVSFSVTLDFKCGDGLIFTRKMSISLPNKGSLRNYRTRKTIFLCSKNYHDAIRDGSLAGLNHCQMYWFRE